VPTPPALTPTPTSPPTRSIEAVVFDVGETLVDETVEYHAWADWLGVPRHTFSAVFGAVIGAGRDHREVFDYFRPGFDLEAERARRAEAGRPEGYGERGLYPDARPAMAALRQAGYLVIIAANQTPGGSRPSATARAQPSGLPSASSIVPTVFGHRTNA